MEAWIQYLLILLILVIIGIAITRSKKKDFKMEMNKLVSYLGGKENIISYEVHKSRFIVNVKDVEKVDKDAIQKLGAQGIVEIENQLKIILGPDATNIKKYIESERQRLRKFYEDKKLLLDLKLKRFEKKLKDKQTKAKKAKTLKEI